MLGLGQENIKLRGYEAAGGINPVGIYTWDVGSLSWIKQAPITGGGGGGGPVTIADGSDVAEGATTDAAVVTDANGTVSGKLRGLVKIFASVWDSINGRLKVDASGVTVPVSQTGSPWGVTGTLGASQSGVWSVGRTWTLASGTDSVGAVQSGAWSTGRTWTLASGTDSVTAQQGGAPWTFTGTKTSNAAAPDATNIGTLPGIANAAAPLLTEGNQVALSTDLAGNARVIDAQLAALIQSRQQDALDGILRQLRAITYYLQIGLNVRDEINQVLSDIDNESAHSIN